MFLGWFAGAAHDWSSFPRRRESMLVRAGRVDSRLRGNDGVWQGDDGVGIGDDVVGCGHDGVRSRDNEVLR